MAALLVIVVIVVVVVTAVISLSCFLKQSASKFHAKEFLLVVRLFACPSPLSVSLSACQSGCLSAEYVI